MSSAFFELGIGVNGLIASQKNLTVTSNNITNANTEGYSRQKAVQRATKAMSAAGAGMIGTGSEVVSISRVRDSYIDTKFRLQNNKLAEYKIKADEMQQISNLFNEPSDSGINTVITNVFDAFQNLTTNASDSSYFETVKQNMNTLLETINTMGQSLVDQQQLINDEVSYCVDQINSIATQIQAINIQINKLEMNGDEASSLRDDRDKLIDDLSEYVNVQTYEELVEGTKDNYVFTVKINGQELVHHDRVNKLVVERYPSYLNPEDENILYDVKWSTGLDFNEYSSTLNGKLKGLIELRDGNGGRALDGTLTSIQIDADNVATVKITGINRADIGDDGVIRIAGAPYVYTSSSYDSIKGELTVVLDKNAHINFVNKPEDPIYRDPQPVNVTAHVGSNVDFRGIPYYINKLNEFVRTLASAMNEGTHRDGSNIEGFVGSRHGYSQDGETGIALISLKDANGNIVSKDQEIDYEKLNIFNMCLSREYEQNSRILPISQVANPGESQLDLIQGFAALKHASIFQEGMVTDFMSSIISEVAMDVNQAQRYQDIQENLVLYTTNKRSSISGVENNEEMTNLVKFQSAYKASARIINVMNQVYDTLINGIFQ